MQEAEKHGNVLNKVLSKVVTSMKQHEAVFRLIKQKISIINLKSYLKNYIRRWSCMEKNNRQIKKNTHGVLELTENVLSVVEKVKLNEMEQHTKGMVLWSNQWSFCRKLKTIVTSEMKAMSARGSNETSQND